MLRVVFFLSLFVVSISLPSQANGETQPYSDDPAIQLEINLPPWLSRKDFDRIIKEVSAETRELRQTHKGATSDSVVELNLVQKRNTKSSIRLEESFTNTLYDLTESLSEYRSGSISNNDLKEEAVSETLQDMTSFAVTRHLDKRALSLSRLTRKTLGKIIGIVVTTSADILRENWQSNGMTNPSDGPIENNWNEKFDKLHFSLRIPF